MKIEAFKKQESNFVTRGFKFINEDSKLVYVMSYSRLLRKGSTWMDDFKKSRKLVYLTKINSKLSVKALIVGRMKFSLVIPFHKKPIKINIHKKDNWGTNQ